MFQLEYLIEKNSSLCKLATNAFKSYVRAYDTHSLKGVFDINTLDLQKVGSSFGFKKVPAIDLSMFCLLILSLFSFSCFSRIELSAKKANKGKKIMGKFKEKCK